MPLEISENKQIGTLTPRQRMLLASGLDAMAPPAPSGDAAAELVAAPAAA